MPSLSTQSHPLLVHITCLCRKLVVILIKPPASDIRHANKVQIRISLLAICTIVIAQLTSCHPTFTDKKVLRPTFLRVSLTKMVQWLILNNSHSYPFCKTMPGTISYLVLAIAPFLSVKLMEISCETIQSVKVRVHLINSKLV